MKMVKPLHLRATVNSFFLPKQLIPPDFSTWLVPKTWRPLISHIFHNPSRILRMYWESSTCLAYLKRRSQLLRAMASPWPRWVPVAPLAAVGSMVRARSTQNFQTAEVKTCGGEIWIVQAHKRGNRTEV